MYDLDSTILETYLRAILRSELFDLDKQLLEDVVDKISFELMDRDLSGTGENTHDKERT